MCLILRGQEVTHTSGTYLRVTLVDNEGVMTENILKKYSETVDCPVRNVLDRFGDKWSTLVILILGDAGTLRFNELHRLMETVSEKMLTVTLKKLDADGLVKRTLYPQVPPRVEYVLTERGRSLLPLLQGLVVWANENMPEIQKSREQYQAA
jgi:DNA-binding HxlR family transcriptional regulator